MNGSGPTTRSSKRKQGSFIAAERPQKQHRLSNGKVSPGDNTPELVMGDAHEPAEDWEEHGACYPLQAGESPEWQDTVENVIRNVVSIRFCQTCAFDTDPALTSEATGFVVDAEKGYILTNRHVVGSGPFWGYVVFDNHEEVDAYPVYRDPVHDFGILRFDPKAIKYMPVSALTLRPEFAKGA